MGLNKQRKLWNSIIAGCHFWQYRPAMGHHRRKSVLYLPTLDQSVSSIGRPFFTIVGYTLPKPL